MIDKHYLGFKLIKLGFRAFMLYLFRFVNGVPFEVEKLHEPLFTQVQNIIDGKDTRVNINLCPRSGKTTIAIWLVVFIITVCPRAQIIYTSFNQDLLKQIAQNVAAILTHPVYQALFGGLTFEIKDENADPVDEFWKEYLLENTGKIKFSARKIVTPQGGVILFNSIGAAITGFGAGLRGNHKGITGILLCFPYDEYVLTEHGRLKIGEIVEKRLNVRVWSYNFNTGKPELQPIDNWIKNPGDDILEVSQGGNSFRCTPDHRVYTLNRGYVPAQDLTANDTLACFPNSLDLLERSPLLVRKVGHTNHSYCLTIRDNHNMYVGKGQGLLVKNCDDADKPTEVRSETIRKKTQTYFVETLFNRLNNSNTPIVNLQQRLHLDDLSGFLTRTYNFKTLKFPLLDAQGNCNLPHQYTQSRIDELKIDNYTFSAQYQQEPIMLGGGLIKHAWWRFYKDQNDTTYRRIFITADTANKTNEWNDFTAIGVWGLTSQNRLRLLDMVHAKMEIPELQGTFLAIWDKWRAGIGTCHCSAIYIEDKASGTQVIQELRRKGGLPILPYVEVKDKLTRVQDALPQIAAGNVELPENDLHPISAEFLAEADAFSADMSHLHDDMVDMMTCAVVQAYNQRGYF